ncbi:uncharacterized protein METZ01_LOCUS507085 [marine metagenome]|uniref:Uncharacterized protein n=1 Tax=marine metagenome TaxID=408172 RepID=A0A383EBY2_9ZZZZ
MVHVAVPKSAETGQIENFEMSELSNITDNYNEVLVKYNK